MNTLQCLTLSIWLMLISSARNLADQVNFIQAQWESMNLENRQMFLKYDFPETKDACKQFLTLVVGVLVFTLTFSEKIINFTTATKAVKRILIAGWVLFILSIILCGLGLGEMYFAAGKAVYNDNTYIENELVAIYLIGISGLLFILGLILLMLDSILMLYQKKL